MNLQRKKKEKKEKTEYSQMKNQFKIYCWKWCLQSLPENVRDLVNNRNLLATFLSAAAESQPQGTYLASVSGFQSK